MVQGDVDVLAVRLDAEPHEKHLKEYSQFLAELGPKASKRPLLSHRNETTTGWAESGLVRYLEITQRRGSRYWGKI